MSDIVYFDGGDAVTTSMAIADGVRNPHSSVIRLVRDNISDLMEFGLLDFKSESSGGRPTEYAILNEQQATLLLTYMRNNDIVRRFKKALIKAFYEMRDYISEQRPQLPDFSNPADAARAWASEYEQKTQYLLERDNAVRAKGEISTKREASVMGKLSAAAKKISKLEEAVGDSRYWKTVKAIGWLSDVFDLAPKSPVYAQIGKKLTATSIDMGYEIHSVDDSSYGAIKSYHVDVIETFHLILINDQAILAKYRKSNSEHAA